MLYNIFITLDFRQQTSHSSSAHKTLWKNPSNCQNSGIFRVELVYIALYRYYITKKSNFNRYRNTLNKTITNAKRVYYKAIFNLYKHDMKKTVGCYL